VITAARTGAAVAVAARCLQPDTRVLAVIGVGRVGCAAVEAFDLAFSNVETCLYDISTTTIEKALARFRNAVKARIHVAATAVDCVKDADVVVTATHSDEALFQEEDVPPGALIIPLGSSRELDPASILRASYLVVDHLEQSKRRALLRQHFAAGRLTDSNIYAEIGAILSGKRPKPDAGEGFGIAVLTGMGSLDVAVGHMVFTKARDRGIGVEFDFQSKSEQRP
jgi:ornithine cyclodeaminase/alanine dehydrogenase-like protein (mu-crystallin family)